eukprot:scaffold736_cov114-Skeletonema_dohrnii-CCMP3373.AAC.7
MFFQLTSSDSTERQQATTIVEMRCFQLLRFFLPRDPREHSGANYELPTYLRSFRSKVVGA